MAQFIQYVVVPVPSKKLAEYTKMEKRWAKIWKSLGATDYVSTIGVDVPMGKLTSFPQALKLKKGELVGVGCIICKSKKHNEQLWKKMMAHPEMMKMDMKKVPFDPQRMFWGGFKQIA